MAKKKKGHQASNAVKNYQILGNSEKGRWWSEANRFIAERQIPLQCFMTRVSCFLSCDLEHVQLGERLKKRLYL